MAKLLSDVIRPNGLLNLQTDQTVGGVKTFTQPIVGQITGSAGSAGSVAWANVSSRPTALSSFTNDTGYITGLADTGVTAGTYNSSSSDLRPFTVDQKGRITSIGTAFQVSTNWASLSGKPTTIAGFGITDGFTTSSTYTGTISSGQVTTALGFTPYNSTNPSGYITSSALQGYLNTSNYGGYSTFSGKLQAGATAPGTSDMARFSGTNAIANDLTLYGPSTSQVRVQFSRSGGSGIGEIGYDMATDTMQIVTGGSRRVAVDSSGNLTVNAGLIGYGTGAGGTVTQVTSKATAVTLNKQSGRITMHGAALAANTQVEFVFNNSYVSSTDAVLIHPSDGSLGHFYEVQTYFAGSGSAHIRVRNISAGSRSDALTLQFTVIKGSTT